MAWGEARGPEPADVARSAVRALLTEEEHRALEVAGDLANRLARIVGYGPTRDEDLNELFGHLHAVQHAIGCQAAARAFPGRYRLLGEVIV